ncbi:1-phosphatidylinositol-4,5-bisphosphate phosphodiesterase beta-2 [Gossypium australe]|uniref:1-phosphatidylinositol-4,5-bisphosphate phosphodiesterase beta-2 n=1 Tax=Gossypium australe TaxID=47621 RepID=A0A5B6WSE5_9ROSI|nr:1-phosphatidylinositol-4,5-bisphosphate phosphodiesterase beta-2 [Gossypium australe]
MSVRGRGRGRRGRGRGRGARAVSEASGHMPKMDVPASPVSENGSQDHRREDNTLTQAMLRVLERVAGTRTGPTARGSISERLKSSGAEVFRGVSGVAPNVVEYWLEAVERIMDDLECTVEQKLRGAVSLLRDEAYQWWLTIRERTEAAFVTWDFFKAAFQGKYVGTSYVDARRKEFLNLVQEYKTVAAYEVEFLRLSRYAWTIVPTDHERCVCFEDGLNDKLQVLIAPQQVRTFATLVEKAKIAEEAKNSERQIRERVRGKRDFTRVLLKGSKRGLKMMSQLKLEHLWLPIRVETVLTVGNYTPGNVGRELVVVLNVVPRIINIGIALDGLLRLRKLVTLMHSQLEALSSHREAVD